MELKWQEENGISSLKTISNHILINGPIQNMTQTDFSCPVSPALLQLLNRVHGADVRPVTRVQECACACFDVSKTERERVLLGSSDMERPPSEALLSISIIIIPKDIPMPCQSSEAAGSSNK